MSRRAAKTILVVAWIAIVFGYLFLLQKIYDKEKGYFLFVLLAISGNLAYDGLKAILQYDPLYSSDGALVVKYVIGFVASLAAAVGSLFLAATLYHFHLIGEFLAQVLGGVGFLAAIAGGMLLISSAERHFKLTNRA